MATSHAREKYRRIIEESLGALGRDDVGVGELSEASDGILRVAFSRGSHTRMIDVTVEALRDKEHARAAINAALLSLSKDVPPAAIKRR